MRACNYYLKMVFEKAEEAERATTELNDFIKNAEEVSDHCCMFWEPNYDAETFEWDQIETNYPTVSEYLKTLDGWRTNPKKIIRLLSFGYDKEFPDETIFFQSENEITYKVCEITYTTNWNPWTAWIKNKYQPLKIGWTSDNDVLYGTETIEFYRWKIIVNDILDKVDPALLIGINSELDELIKQKLKGISFK